MCRKILHGLDGSEGSFKALAQAIDLSKRLSVPLHTISIEEVPHYPATIGEVIEEKATADGQFGNAIQKARELASRRVS